MRPALAYSGESASKSASTGRRRDQQTRASGEFSPNTARFTASRPGDTAAREEKGGLNFLYTWLAFTNTFLAMQKENGFEQYMYEKWILGKHFPTKTNRWSVVRDALHWVD